MLFADLFSTYSFTDIFGSGTVLARFIDLNKVLVFLVVTVH